MLFLILQTSSFILPAKAAIIYSGIQNIDIPMGVDGVYLNIITGATASSEPGSWTTAPWLNPFQGGVDVGNSDLLCPVISGPSDPFNPDTIINLAIGQIIDTNVNCTGGENISMGHTSAVVTPNMFTLGAPGYIGFKFKPTLSSTDTFYGWAQVVFTNTGSGAQIIDWAYNNVTDEGIFIGMAVPAPEPGRAMLLGFGLVGLLMRRQRRAA